MPTRWTKQQILDRIRKGEDPHELGRRGARVREINKKKKERQEELDRAIQDTMWWNQ